MRGRLKDLSAVSYAVSNLVKGESNRLNALRSISLRIRGYDEETEQLSEDLVDIKGKVIDLTKTASNPQGVSLFTDETQTEYKSIYQYLQEISQIYDELGAKEKQDLMELLFGKNRANIGQAILQNFSAAEKAMDNMSNSAGNADAEMEVIEQSIEYKLNALKETWVGIAQDLFNREDVGNMVERLTDLSEAIGWLVDKLGLVGTAVAGIGITAIVKNFDSSNEFVHHGCESMAA